MQSCLVFIQPFSAMINQTAQKCPFFGLEVSEVAVELALGTTNLPDCRSIPSVQ